MNLMIRGIPPTCPLITVLEIWEELTLAKHGLHGYGGDTAEIYSYRFQRNSPSRTLKEGSELRKEADKKAWVEAKECLVAILCLYMRHYSVVISVNGEPLHEWMSSTDQFSHRVHVRVIPE